MKIHEFQAKAILARYGVPVPRGEVAHTPSDVAVLPVAACIHLFVCVSQCNATNSPMIQLPPPLGSCVCVCVAVQCNEFANDPDTSAVRVVCVSRCNAMNFARLLKCCENCRNALAA